MRRLPDGHAVPIATLTRGPRRFAWFLLQRRAESEDPVGYRSRKLGEDISREPGRAARDRPYQTRSVTEAGVRKASKEETAGGVCAGGSVGLWGFKARFCATWPLSDGTAGLIG